MAESPNSIVESSLNDSLVAVEDAFDADGIAIVGGINYGLDDVVKDHVEAIENRKNAIAVVLETNGGYIDVAERIAGTLRHHYKEVEFIVPNFAMSAGTVLVMSGDSVHMDYYAVLGPIDPQIRKAGVGWVPALGYLKQFESLVDKSRAGTLTDAELAFMVKRFDPAELHQYEQAREQTMKLLRQWLTKFKFKDWKTTRKRGEDVTPQMKEDRANEIAAKLNETERWHSHGRGIPMAVLTAEGEDGLNLQIEDFRKDDAKKDAVLHYYRLLKEYMSVRGWPGIVQSNNTFSPLELQA